jgi:hypothetical protein
MTMSMTGSGGYRPTGGRQQMGGYDIHSMSKYPQDIVEQARRLYGKSIPGLESGLDYTSRLAQGDESLFQEVEAPAHRQFGAYLGNIASRFSQGAGGPGGTSARRSSGFGLATSNAAQEFAEKLQSQRMGYRQQAIKDLRAMVQELMGAQEQQHYGFPAEEEEQPWQKFVGAGLPIAGAAVGGYFGGLPGAKLGATAGAAAGKAFF